MSKVRVVMDLRENLLRALRRDHPQHVPWSLSLCPALLDELHRRAGTCDAEAYFSLPYRTISLAATAQPPDYHGYYRNGPEPDWIDEWGIGHIRGGLEHFTRMLHPMEGFADPGDVYGFPMPDVLAEYRWSGMEARIESIQRAGLAAMYSAVQVFEPAWYLRGMEALLTDMATGSPMAAACLDRMTAVQSEISRRVAKAGVDIIVYGDDVGTQRAMMMSPAMWRKWLKPAMKAVISAAKAVNPAVIAYYHSDGVIEDIIADLIEIGVDVLNPVQPECMDPVRIKRQYGERLSFWGTIGTQSTMPFGSVDDVRDAVKGMVESVGAGGGLVVAPTHLLEPEVPWVNIEAFVEAVEKFGKYE